MNFIGSIQYCMTTMDIQAGGFTARLSKAESDINQAAKNLEKAFHGANSVSRESGEQELPDPIRLVRRITALEIALGNLKKDCEIVSERRSEVVQNVLSMQSDTVARVKELLRRTEDEDPYSSHDDTIDETWISLTKSLEKQMGILRGTETTE